MNKTTTVALERITKKYVIHHEKPMLSEKLFLPRNEQFIALQDISLTIKKREKVGIIGRNGAGKTTFLKIICGITAPTRGTIRTNGRVIPIIDLEAGFHPDLTGEQNIYLNGLILGMNRRQIRRKVGDIIRFAQLGQFIDVPLFTYSQGMKFRLGFSIAVHADPEILVLDEGISAGDKDFQKKTRAKIEELFRSDKTVIIASHWLDFLEENCDRILWFEKGKIIRDGGPEIVRKYRKAL